MGTAFATGLLLPGQAFVATSVVGVEGGPAALRPALIQAAADTAVSRQVMSRAGASIATPDPSGKRAADRILDRLSSAIRIETGRVPGTLLVRAADADGERAAAMATAVATALVADMEDRAQETRHAADAAAALRLAGLQEAVVAAHRHLADLGGDLADPAATRAASAARVEALRARLDAIRAILAGDPPLGAGRDVPPNLEALQTSYLDLTRQLAKARETLGDRHTTVVGLQDGIKRTATELVQGWTRLAKATEAELADVKARVASAAKGGAGDASRIAAARAAAQSADEAVAQVQAMSSASDDTSWRVVARAPVPALTEGLAAPFRIGAALAAALLVILASLAMPRRRAEREAASAEPMPLAAETAPAEPAEQRFFEAEDDATPERTHASLPPSLGGALAAATLRGSTEARVEDDDFSSETPMNETLPGDRPMDTRSPAPRRDTDFDLVVTMARVLPCIEAVAPCAEVPVVLVATNEPGVGTMESVLALGEAAAATGLRVLVVEGGRARPALAAAVEEAAQPALVEAFGGLRIVLPAETGGGLLFLAPSFRDGARLAADLTRSGDTLVADDLADEFDLVVIDGDRAADAAALAHHADCVLRIGRFASPRDDERFLETLGTPRSAFLGTVAAAVAVFVPRAAETSRPAEPQRPLAATHREVQAPRPAMRAPFVAPRRPTAPDLRRRAGLR